MATQKQDEKRGNGGGGQSIAVHRGQQDRQLSRDRGLTARRIPRTNPFSMMRRMLDNLDDFGTWGSPLGLSSPFVAMRRMFDDMERTLDTDVVGDVGWNVRDRDYIWAPRIEITQREDNLLVRADVPGVPQDQIQISAEGDSLVIEGERALPSDEQEDVWCSECAHGKFRRVVALPQGADPDKAEAHYENGVLEISIPVPAMQARGRKIQIQTGGEDRSSPQLEKGSGQQQKQAEKH